jgi:DNA-binding GntR family transcriptional regulator
MIKFWEIQTLARSVDIRTRLLDDIASGGIGPGDKLTIDELAQRYEASHMPVREALRELHGAGLLRQGSGRTMRLAEFNRDTIENLFNTRSAIEVMLTRQAAQRFTRRDAEKLEEIESELEHAVDAGDHGGVLAANRHFHTAIYALAENEEANSIVERHWLFIRLLWSRVGFGAERYGGVINDHRHLMRALSANDVEAAAVLMGAHVIKAKYGLLQRMALSSAKDS